MNIRQLQEAFFFETVATVCLTVTFNTFNVEVFLKAYHLSLESYAVGHLIYAVINTANDLGGAWMVDHISAQKGDRAALIKLGGMLWSIAFLTPWFRWENPGGSESTEPYPFMAAVHFVAAMSLYDTMYSFCAIVSGSVITELNITDSQRIQILRVRTIVGMIAAFLVSQLGQHIYDKSNKAGDLSLFHSYVVAIGLFSAFGFFMFYQKLRCHPAYVAVVKSTNTKLDDEEPQQSFSIFSAISDFRKLKNFHSWIGMEMFLETQINFNRGYMRIILLQFLAPRVTLAYCTLVISLLPTITQILKLLMFHVIDKTGIYFVYRWSFLLKISVGILCYIIGQHEGHIEHIIVFFFLFGFIVTELPTNGYGIAMSNMNAEMQVMQLREGRVSEPSFAGMFMGFNALFCKPMDSILPIIAAKRLQAAGFQDQSKQTVVAAATNVSTDVKQAFLEIVVLPSIILGVVQFASWSRYTLHGAHLKKVKTELKELKSQNELHQLKGKSVV